MTPERNPSDGPDHLFIVGCPRSGTTWLQLLLAQHPAVATVKESHLLDHFIGPALESWDRLADDPRRLGLGEVLSRHEFVHRLRCFADEVTARIAGPETRLVVDKTPDHALWIGALREVFPDAAVLHMIRDPRDTVASLLAASDGWAEDWAPRTAYHAAWRWCQYVRGARAAGDRVEEYRELRYEDLHSDPSGELTGLLRWLGLESPPDLVRAAVRETSLDRMKRGEASAPWDLADEPEGFVRSGGTGSWRSELSRSQIGLVEYMCRDLMRPLGYEPTRSRRLPPLAFFWPWLRDQLLRSL